MTKLEKIEFINGLVDDIKQTIVKNVDRMPEEWDGHELRQYITETFADLTGANTFGNKRQMQGKRLQDYRNTIVVHNLYTY